MDLPRPAASLGAARAPALPQPGLPSTQTSEGHPEEALPGTSYRFVQSPP